VRINKFDTIYFGLIFTGLIAVYYKFFSFPMLSDCWEMFYSFHHLDLFPGPIKWLHVLNLDAFEKIRYQPLSHMIYFWIHHLAGANYVWFNLINFIFYFLNIILLYRLFLLISVDRIIAAVSCSLFAFMFSHCGILIWAQHIYVLLGFGLFLSGFILYIKYLESKKIPVFILTSICFLFGMWCYEPFFFWPLGIIILRIALSREEQPYKIYDWVLLILLYFLYFFFFLFTRMLGTYTSTSYGLSSFLKPDFIIISAISSLFNIIYNGFLINAIPLLAFPLEVTENIYMRGPLLSYVQGKNNILVAALIVVIPMVIFFKSFLRMIISRGRDFWVITFLAFLIITELYIISFCRLITNPFGYIFTEFRYQYAQNAFLILIFSIIIGNFCKLKKKLRKNLLFALILIASLNILCVNRVIEIGNSDLADFKQLVLNIKNGINNGNITENRKLYIDRKIFDYLPSLCWNIEMGDQFIKNGSLEWMFSRKEASLFTHDIEDAVWIISKNDFNLIKNNSVENIKRPVIAAGKDEQYLNLGYVFNNKGDYKKAEEMFTKALAINPRSFKAYMNLGHLYNWQGRIYESEKAFQLAIKLKPHDDGAYRGLGVCYTKQEKWVEAENMLKMALKLNPKSSDIYNSLGHLYRAQGRLEECEVMFHKALKIEPKNNEAIRALKECRIEDTQK